MRVLCLALAAFLLYAGPPWDPRTALAAEGGCGTVIIPTGTAVSPPAGVGSLNPLLTTGQYAHEVIEQFLRPLVWIDRHGRPDPTRSIARSVETTDDGESFVVTLQDWRWSDGVPITADDLIFTLDLIKRLGAGYVFDGTGGVPDLIASWRALNLHQVELRMTRKVNPRWFVSLGLGNILYPLPKHVFQGLSLLDLRRRQNDPTLFAVGDGPFLLEDFAVGRHVVLVPNPFYGGQHPQIGRLIVSFPTGNTALEQLRSGELDAANVPYLLSDFVHDIDDVHTVDTAPNDTFGEGIFNFHSTDAPFLADIAVRRAITRAIDQKEIISLVFHGRATVEHGPVPHAMVDLQSAAAKAGYPDLSYDPSAARAGLAADGWSPGPDGTERKHGRKLAFTMITSTESSNGVMMAQIIQRDLAKIGMAVNIHTIGFNQLLATLEGNGHAWDLAMLNWTIDTYPDVHDFFASDGTQNYGHYRNPEMDRLTDEEMFGSGDEALHAMQDFTAEQIPYLYLPAGTPQVLTRDGLGGVGAFASPNGMWSAELLTLSGPLACAAGGDHAAGR